MNEMIQTCLGPDYVMLSSICLQATHLVIYVSKRLSSLISEIVTDTCALGFNGTMGNKGAVMVKFNFVDT